MGFYYDQRPPDNGDDANLGCLDALVISKVVLQVLFWPIAALLLVILDVGFAFYLYSIHPALVLVPVAITTAGIYLLARWDQQRHLPENLPRS